MARRAKPSFAALEERLGYKFGNSALLEQAMTHVSAINSGKSRSESYQRLEFLGDRVLGLSVSEMLFVHFPKASEGEMSRRLAELVRLETCAEVAADWGLADWLRLGAGEASTGGARKAAILGDICEALIGAVFVDGGYTPARALVEKGWAQRMQQPRRPLRDPKTALQEWAQARGKAPPVYREIDRAGPAHKPEFTIAVDVEGYASIEARGASKRVAEQAAARAFMQRENIKEGKE
jgi:ribonuclease-3